MTTATKEKVSHIAGERPVARLLAVDKLTVYPEVQRNPPTKKLVKELADNMDLSALGTFHVSQRGDGTFSVMDGQRRKLALEARGLASYRVNALVYSGLSIPQEAAMFRLLNKSRLVSLHDDFSKGVVAGDERDVGITKILQKIQWAIKSSSSPGVACCIKAFRGLWDHDGNGSLLARTVTLLDEVFGRDKNTMATSLVSGMGKFLAKDGVDRAALVDKLKAKFNSPVSVVTTARARQAVEGGALNANVSAVIQATYEGRRRATR